jgi:hypothetical protein
LASVSGQPRDRAASERYPDETLGYLDESARISTVGIAPPNVPICSHPVAAERRVVLPCKR